MRKPLIIMGLSLAALNTLTACQADRGNGEKASLYEKSGNTINRTDRNEIYNDQGNPNGKDSKLTNFGYVRQQKSPLPGDNRIYDQHIGLIDREEVADAISKLCITLPNINEAATLVTDEEVLIAYDTDSENRFEAADMVKKTALSLVPRWYHVYVSDNPRMMNDISRFGRLDANSGRVDSIINGTIQEMLKDPQGRPVDSGEDANGEMYGEMNQGNDREIGEYKAKAAEERAKLLQDGTDNTDPRVKLRKQEDRNHRLK